MSRNLKVKRNNDLHQALMIAEIGYWHYSSELQVFDWSETFPNPFGTSFQTFLQAIIPDDRNSVHQWFSALSANEATTPIEFRVMQEQAAYRWMMMRGTILADSTQEFVGVIQDISAYKQVEQPLREDAERFQILSDLLWDYAFAYDVDADGQFHQIWATAEPFTRMTGYHWDEIGSRFILYHPEDVTQVQADVQKTLRGEITQGEYRILTKSGELRWVHLLRKPVWDNKLERVTRFYGIAEDITERKLAEEAQRVSEEHAREFQYKLKALQEITIELSRINTLDDLYRKSVELAKSPLGFHRFALLLLEDDMIQCTFGVDEKGQLRDERQLRHPIAEDAAVKQIIASRKRVHIWEDVLLWDEWQVVGRGWSAMAVLWDGDTSIGWLATDNLIGREAPKPYMLDLLAMYAATLGRLITQKQSEAARARSESRFRLMAEHSPAGIFIVDDAYRFVYANEQLCKILGYPRDELVGMDFRDVLDAKSRELIADRYVRRQRGEVITPRYELDIVTKRNQMRHVEMSVTALRDEGGQIVSVGQLVDLSDRVEAEARNLELALEREKIELMGVFVGNVSHDLKTPLTTIKSCLYLLEKIDDAEKRKEKLEIIREQTRRVDDLIQKLLTISRLDNLTQLELEHVAVNTLIQDIGRVFAPQCEKKHIRLILDLDPSLQFAIVDEDEFQRAMSNLVENAIQYTPEGASITIRSRLGDGSFSVEISDTGFGISEEDLPHIFNRFYRANQARASFNGGSGLGLSIVKRIVEMHGGNIQVESVIGHGSSFKIVMPAHSAR